MTPPKSKIILSQSYFTVQKYETQRSLEGREIKKRHTEVYLFHYLDKFTPYYLDRTAFKVKSTSELIPSPVSGSAINPGIPIPPKSNVKSPMIIT